ncbi:MAG: lipase family protein, partial [Alphaproteobacteria bacterium]
VPYQYSYGAKIFTSDVLEKIDRIDDYKIYLTGHSLGAVISELTAVEYAAKYDFHTIVFESLGSYDIVAKNFAVDDHNFDNIVIYNIPQNILNSTNEQLVKTIPIQVTASNGYFSKIINLLPANNIISIAKNHWFNNIYSFLKDEYAGDKFYEELDFCPINPVENLGITTNIYI